MRTTKTTLAILTGIALAGAIAVQAHAQLASTTSAVVAVAPGAAAAVESTKVTATVVGIDATTRVVTLKGQDGKVFNITAGDDVKNFAQLRVGDKVTASYTQALSLELKKGGSGIRESSEKESAVRAPAGAKPGGAVSRQVTILANVVAVDAKKKTVTLRGPHGNLVDLAVQDPAQLKSIKKGDQVEAVYTEAVAVTVEAAPKAAPKGAAKPEAKK
jgi:Cu/Ag efflux protein CusF